MFKRAIFCFLILINVSLTGQTADTSQFVFKQAEEELFTLQQPTFRSRGEKERFEANRQFIAVWDRIVSNPAILQYSFAQLKDISVLTSPDKKFKLITWNVPKDDGTHAFFGYLLVNNIKRIKKGFLKHITEQEYEFYKLIDRSATVRSPETHSGGPDKWFGMLYTQLIACDGYYTLIGWDGNDKLIQRKFIDVLYFKADGQPVFGKDVFRIPRKNPRRLMFEYSAEVSMSIKYNSQDGMIVYSELGPDRHGNVLDGQYQYYGPTGDFKGLRQKNGKWVPVEEVNSNSAIKPTPENKKPNPRKQTPVYKP